MKKKLFIPVLVGTTRPGRQTLYVARLVAQVGNKIEAITPQLIDPIKLRFPLDGSSPEVKDGKYSQITQEADGFFIVAPEYNHSFPGSLKRMLDSERQNYIHKPVAFASVSAGPWGGVRAIESLVPVVRELGLVATFTDVNFPFVQDLFDEKGNLKDKNYIEKVKKTYEELVWMARVLKWGRENLRYE